jgi:hypothetical protein
MVRIFKHAIGRRALTEGGAPELCRKDVSVPKCPSEFAAKLISEAAAPAVKRMTAIEARLAQGRDVPPCDAAWRDNRLAEIRKCEDIAKTGGDA